MLARGSIVERLVWSLGSVLGLPVSERNLEGGQVKITVMALPELPSHRAVEPLDAPVARLGLHGGNMERAMWRCSQAVSNPTRPSHHQAEWPGRRPACR